MSSDGDAVEHNAGYTYRQAWGPSARIEARARLQGVMDDDHDLMSLVDAAARVVRELLAARTATVTVLDGEAYRDLVKVGDLEPGEEIVSTERYPMELYPEATARLLARRPYVSTERIDEIEQEHEQLVPPTLVSCFMGVPIVADGAVRGELFVTRVVGAPQFTADDVEVAGDLATQFGVQLGALLAKKHVDDPLW